MANLVCQTEWKFGAFKDPKTFEFQIETSGIFCKDFD